MGKRIGPFVENIVESSAACLIMMVQGNLLALNLGHWLIASETGLAAGTIAGLVILAAKIRRRWIISIVLGLVTFAVDSVIHSGEWLTFVPGAVMTGLGAALLSFLAGLALRRFRAKRKADHALESAARPKATAALESAARPKAAAGAKSPALGHPPGAGLGRARKT